MDEPIVNQAQKRDNCFRSHNAGYLIILVFPGWSVDLISSGAFLSARLSQSADLSSSAFEEEIKKLKILVS